jgi:hypothetical protein
LFESCFKSFKPPPISLCPSCFWEEIRRKEEEKIGSPVAHFFSLAYLAFSSTVSHPTPCRLILLCTEVHPAKPRCSSLRWDGSHAPNFSYKSTYCCFSATLASLPLNPLQGRHSLLSSLSCLLTCIPHHSRASSRSPAPCSSLSSSPRSAMFPTSFGQLFSACGHHQRCRPLISALSSMLRCRVLLPGSQTVRALQHTTPSVHISTCSIVRNLGPPP